jgi:hypothetical protein
MFCDGRYLPGSSEVMVSSQRDLELSLLVVVFIFLGQIITDQCGVESRTWMRCQETLGENKRANVMESIRVTHSNRALGSLTHVLLAIECCSSASGSRSSGEEGSEASTGSAGNGAWLRVIYVSILLSLSIL